MLIILLYIQERDLGDPEFEEGLVVVGETSQYYTSETLLYAITVVIEFVRRPRIPHEGGVSGHAASPRTAFASIDKLYRAPILVVSVFRSLR